MTIDMCNYLNTYDNASALQPGSEVLKWVFTITMGFHTVYSWIFWTLFLRFTVIFNTFKEQVTLYGSRMLILKKPLSIMNSISNQEGLFYLHANIIIILSMKHPCILRVQTSARPAASHALPLYAYIKQL